MLQGIFNYHNPVWRFIGKLGDLMILNILWVICSIPIFTMGASTTAVYYVTMKLVRGDDGYTLRNYFKSFKENFKQATVIWLLMLLTGFILGFDLYFFLRVLTSNSVFRTVFTAAIGALSMIWLCIFSYVFPLQCRFYNPVKRTLFNAFFMSILWECWCWMYWLWCSLFFPFTICRRSRYCRLCSAFRWLPLLTLIF